MLAIRDRVVVGRRWRKGTTDRRMRLTSDYQYLPQQTVVSTALGSAVSQPLNSSPTQVAFDIERRTAARLTQIMKKKKHSITRRKKHSEEEKHTRPFSRDQDRPEVISRRFETKIKTRELQHRAVTATQFNPPVDRNSYSTVRQRAIRTNCDMQGRRI